MLSTSAYIHTHTYINYIAFSRSTDVTSTDLVSAKGKTKEVYCCDIDVLIVLFCCF